MMNIHSLMIVGVIALITLMLRYLPFAVFNGDKETPSIISYLGKVLPYAIMGMLVVFCLKDISIITKPHGIPEFISCITVVLLHVWKRNTLLSIVAGTLCYMLLIHTVF